MNMLQDDLRGLHIWPVEVQRNGPRALGIDKAVVCHLDLVLPLCHGGKGLKEVTVVSDVICLSSVRSSMISRSIC